MPQAAAATDAGWRPRRLLSAPHRLAFFAAALMLAASALWWAAALAARQAGLVLPWAVAPPVAHGLLMTMGFMPMFIAGFLFTAGPRWLALPAQPARLLGLPLLAMGTGWLLALAGFHLDPGWAAAGLSLVAAGWTLVVLRFGALLRRSAAADRLHARGLLAAAAIGVPVLGIAAWALARGDVASARGAVQLALWVCIAPVFLVASHRMLPFLAVDDLPGLARWPDAAVLGLGLAVLAGIGAGAAAEALQGPPAPPWRWAQAAVEVTAALGLLTLAWRFARRHGLRQRMLAMLWGGFVWLGLALALAALSHALQAGGGAGLGLAPTHALGMGWLGATMIAMVTRVVASHAGHGRAADDVAWALYLGLQAATLLRVTTALWPAAPPLATPVAAVTWALVATAWSLRYGRWLGLPRADGRPDRLPAPPPAID